MTQVHYHMPPELERAGAVDGMAGAAKLCVVCLMFAKGDQVARTRDIWQPLVNDGDDSEQRWITYAEKSPIREACVVGINDMFPGQLLALCWDHLGAIAPPDPAPACTWCNGTGRKKGSGLQAASGPLPPGLSNGGRKMGRG